MKVFIITFLILGICLLNESAAEKIKKHKKYRKHHHKTSTTEDPEVEDSSKTDEEIGLAADLKKEARVAKKEPNYDNEVPVYDECLKVHCGAGRICQVDENGEPQCVCIPQCPVEAESRRKVCTNHNETWTSDCAVYQQRCFCETGDKQCKGEEFKHVHIEYYGECKDMPDCSKEEMVDFPRRMRDWLFNIMRDLADRDELSSHYLKMEREAETNMTRRWSNAAIWKFCDLDGNPPDRSVSRHELFPIRAPLMSLEHCIAPFLNSCDENNNHRITLEEWAKCLELEEDEIENRCEELQDDEL